MKSPFPGMDPFIEAYGFWEDFHHGLIEKIAEALSPNLPRNYMARTGERAYVVLVEEEGKKESMFQPDVGITSLGTSGRVAAETGVAVAVETETEPVSMRPFITEKIKESFVEIYELHPERRLVTCIEVLSPSNKRRKTPGWKQYQRKRQALFMSDTNLVEIDLLRGGTKMPMLDPWPKSPYTLLVARSSWGGAYCRVWPAHFTLPLPAIPVPLTQPDPPVELKLQPLVEAIYSQRRYDSDIDYRKPLRPPLSTEEITWLQAQLQARTEAT